MKILYVCLDRGIDIGGTKGAAIHVTQMVGAFRAEGHDVTVLARRGVPADGVVIAAAPSGHVTGPLATLRRDVREVRIGPHLSRQVAAAIAAYQPDLVYERYALFRAEGAAAASASRIAHVLEVNATLVDEEMRFRGLALTGLARRAERRAWRRTSLVVVPSTALADSVRAQDGAPVVVVPNAVDPEVFVRRGGRAAVRARLGLGDEFVVGFTGSMKAWHDLPVLVDAIAALAGSVTRAVAFLAVGDGPARDDAVRRAADAGVRVVTTGAVGHADVPAYIEAMDVCVTPLTADPTLHYFSPLKALEYLALGVPTVVAAAGDLRALIDAGLVTGYRPGDAADLSARLRDVLDDPAGAAARVVRGESYAREHTWRAAARTIVQAAASIRPNASRA